MNAHSPQAVQQSWQDAAGRVHAGPVHETVGDFSVVDCACCGFKHVLPLPTPEQLREVYAHDYYTQEKPAYIEHYLQDKPWWDAVYAERYQRLEGWLPATRRRLLDVGSGPGLFLLNGRERGWQVRGIEPSAQAAAHSRDSLGLDVQEGFLDEHSVGALGRYDALNLGEVLEHLPDPAGMLSLAHRLLDDDGVLCTVVPNDFNPVQQLLREQQGFKPWWVAPPHHLNYFDHASLSALVARCGFEVLHVESTFPIDLFLLMGQNYIGNDTLGRQVHGQRKQLEQALLGGGAGELKARLYKAFADCGIGREVVLFARKKCQRMRPPAETPQPQEHPST
jgi:SAM-dependent methyltransferase